MTIWQIAAGDSARDYTELFLRYDVMLMSPGDPGNFIDNKKEYKKDRMGHQIRSFCQSPKAGDLVLLRYGRVVKAVGIIPDIPNDTYFWSETFDDVLGWDSQHVRRVIWDPNAVSVLNQESKGLFSKLPLQRTFYEVHEERITLLANQLVAKIKKRPLKALPKLKGGAFSQDELGMELFNAGLPNNAVESVLSTILRIKRLASWYSTDKSGNRPSEHEIVAHMISPLLLGMGWSEQLLAIEWNKIDLAFFNKTPTDKQNCIMICEAKQPSESLKSSTACCSCKGMTSKFLVIWTHLIINSRNLHLSGRNRGLSGRSRILSGT
jgi:hypothetical protein